MLNVRIQNRTNTNGHFISTSEEFTTTSLSEREITTVLENIGIKEFAGTNYAQQTYQTMPGWVHITLNETATLTDILMKGMLKN